MAADQRVKDHPRTRGEKEVPFSEEASEAGSPPHTRGKGQIKQANTQNYRITPAHAGKSASASSCAVARKDHPRTRGEKKHMVFYVADGVGSPPHTRGKVRGTSLKRCSGRITPAHAGKRRRGVWLTQCI